MFLTPRLREPPTVNLEADHVGEEMMELVGVCMGSLVTGKWNPLI